MFLVQRRDWQEFPAIVIQIEKPEQNMKGCEALSGEKLCD